jgi:UDP-N-acetylmuramoyl-tripeptide--D-alanyl-D-alanine ligase
MKPLSINNLAKIINAELKTSSDGFFTGVCIDSRTVKTGDCFFAIAGDKFDGHNFLDQAFKNGAACAVVSKIVPTTFADKPLLLVADTIAALGKLANFYRNNLNPIVIAITGSAGKTTTRQIIHHCLSRRFAAVQSPKSFNNNIGLPLTILSAQSDTKIIVAEIGSNHPGEIAPLSKIAAPDIALITNIYPAHLEGFGSLAAITKEKSSIADGLKENGTLIINADSADGTLLDPPVAGRRKNVKKLITFGSAATADIRASGIESAAAGSRFKIDNTEIFLPLPGPGNIQNALAAWAVCKELGIKLSDFADSLKRLPAVAMRAEILQIGRLTIINDCYNANPASMANALQILSNFDSAGNRRLVFLCGDMNELGKDSQKLHAELGFRIARSKVSLLITVGPLAAGAAEAAKSSNNSIQVISYPDTATACNNLLKFVKNTDIILIKGSRAVGLEKAVETLKMLFELKV